MPTTCWREWNYKDARKSESPPKLSRRGWVLRLITPESNRVSRENKHPPAAEPEHAPSKQPVGENQLLAFGCQLLASLRNVLLDCLLPFALRFENVFDRVASRALSSGVGRSPVRLGFHLGPRVLYRDREAALAHRRQIDHIVAHERGL